MASCVRQASGLSRLFLPLDSDGTSYEGFVDVVRRQYHVVRVGFRACMF